MNRSYFLTLALLAALAPLPAAAYNPGGHHDTLAASFATGHAPSDSAAEALRLEAFCAQLPDLAEELDAVTQREHVFVSEKDWGWGVFSACWTPTSTHMVTSQFYLHGLTGKSADQVRSAAHGLIQGLDGAIAAGGDASTLAQLHCERGFAEHLLGDTYAHTVLDGDGQLYKTGFGHARDYDTPDRMLTRPQLWNDWVQDIHDRLDSAADAGAVERLAQGINNGPDVGYGETDLVKRLQHATQSYWDPFTLRLDEWTNPPQSSGPSLVGAIEDAYRTHILQTTCQDQIDRGPANRDGGTGAHKLLNANLDCGKIWKDYLARARAAFDALGVRPPHGCEGNDDQLSDGHLSK